MPPPPLPSARRGSALGCTWSASSLPHWSNDYPWTSFRGAPQRDPSGNWCEVREEMASGRSQDIDRSYGDDDVRGMSEDPDNEAQPAGQNSLPTETLHCEDLTEADLWVIAEYLGGGAGWSAFNALATSTGLAEPLGSEFASVFGAGGQPAESPAFARERDEWAWMRLEPPGIIGCPETPTKLPAPGLAGPWPPQALGAGIPVNIVLYLESRAEFVDPYFSPIWGALYTGTMHVTFNFGYRVLRTYRATGIVDCVGGGGDFVGHASGN